ncbi:heterokaryon incompatibility protein-domain-containing protein [Cercophora newfieldiana]|uniref:Heterokaryon incompatibility protein-domain-containing protein n=1 Tax=Cercophora newfieldiana TaxID=92897 RepID=A0AA40CUE6_9PEZI|nr:heterokaryon incompatibility protein-domain-containing protein [Cercophora newfieldiana]
MLRYLRHKDRRRTLWVDAICINQHSPTEKATQVPCMDAIYKRAMRVIAYLGSPAATSGDRSFPPRVSIDELEMRTLENMLELRYFGRLWVIQELILARSAVFVFDGFECHAQPSTMPTQISWKNTPAPWLKYLGARSFPQDVGITDALRLTSKSTCADLRDMCFGALGLVQQPPARGLEADYTLSALRLFVGLASHCLINEERLADVLLNSVGADGWGRQPSWVPNWSTGSTGLPRRYEPVPWDSRFPRDSRSNAFAPVETCIGPLTERRDRLYPSHAYRPSVDARNGALSLQLLYFSPISEILDTAPRSKARVTKGLHRFRVRGGRFNLDLFSYSQELCKKLAPGNDHIFYATQGNLESTAGALLLPNAHTTPGVALLMRKLDERSNKYMMIAPLQRVAVVPPSPLSRDRGLEGLPTPMRRPESEDYGHRFTLMDLIDFNNLKSPPKGLPVLAGDRIIDPTLEKDNPRLARLRDARITLRIYRQMFPGTRRAPDTIDALTHFLTTNVGYPYDCGIIGGFPRFDEFWGPSTGRVPPPFISRQGPEAFQSGFQTGQFGFQRGEFDYVREWYIEPVYSKAEDPDGSRTRREHKLIWGALPVWEWYDKRSDRWDTVTESVTLVAFLQDHETTEVILRTRPQLMKEYLWKNSWEVGVVRKLVLKFCSMSRAVRDSLGVKFPTDLLGLDADLVAEAEGTRWNSEDALDRHPVLPRWPYQDFNGKYRDFSGKHVLVTIL